MMTQFGQRFGGLFECAYDTINLWCPCVTDDGYRAAQSELHLLVSIILSEASVKVLSR
jgi:hypothetical protein